jgi:hypothetical protein
LPLSTTAVRQNETVYSLTGAGRKPEPRVERRTGRVKTLKVVEMANEDPQGQSATTTGGPEAGPSQPAPAKHNPWHDRMSSFAGWMGGHLRSPRTRLCVVGVILLLAGVLQITGSVWTLPLIVIGIVMVVIAWVGSRLDGRFAVEWGEGGTQVEFRAQIKPPPPVIQPVRLSPIPSAVPSAHASQLRTHARSELGNTDVIDGEGHTVEIDVTELKLLIRAAEAREAARDGGADRHGTEPDESQRRPAA